MSRKSSEEFSNIDSPSEDDVGSPSKKNVNSEDRSDTMSLSESIRKGARQSGMKLIDSSAKGSRVQGKSDSMQNLSKSASPRNSKHFSFLMSPKRGSKKRIADDTASVKSFKVSERAPRTSNLRVGDVLNSALDDTSSFVGSVLEGSSSHRQEGLRSRSRKKSKLFGWSRSRISENTRSRSQTFYFRLGNPASATNTRSIEAE